MPQEFICDLMNKKRLSVIKAQSYLFIAHMTPFGKDQDLYVELDG